jgi:hypothetical protein
VTGLSYVGVGASGGAGSREIERRLSAEGVFGAGMSRSYVSARAHTLALPKALKTYIDSQDATFAVAGYAASQDALLVPNAARGTASGVAALDSTGKVPTLQVPILGAGMLRGPYGPVNAVTSDIDATVDPVKLFDVWSGPLGVNGLIWPYFEIVAKTSIGRTTIEVRAGSAPATTYAAQTTLLARGVGRSFFYDWQPIEIWPQTPDLNMGQDGVQHSFSASDNLNISCWMFDEGGGTSSTKAGYTVTAALYFARTSL